MSDIKCPKCGNLLDIKKLMDSEFKEEFQRKQAEFEHKMRLKELEFQKMQDEFLQKVEDKSQELAKQKSIEIENKLKQKIQNENLAKFEALQKELNEKSEEISKLNLENAQIQRLKRENLEFQSKLKIENEIKLNEAINNEREKIALFLNEQNELKFRQKDEELKRLKTQIDELKRKSEITSAQLIGETQELAIEQYLKSKFVLDEICEIKKGVNGADCLQIVNTKEMSACAKIYYESKRTKSFSRSWIEKFKEDMRENGADVGILVTQTMPNELERMGLLDGIWVCSFEEFKALCEIIRVNAIEIAYAKKSVKNQGSKMELLYSYLSGNEFKMQIEAIVEAFVGMQEDLESEKRAMMRIWKNREKQIEKAKINAINMHSSIRGIAGNSIKKIDALEFKDDFLSIE